MLQFVNGVDSKDNPQIKELLKVVHDLNSLLTAEGVIDRFCKDGYIPQNIQDEVKEIVNKISEGDYQSPADDVLIASSTEKLSKLLNNYKDCGDQVMIVIEACLFDKLDDHTRNNLVPDGSKIFSQLDIDGDVAERVIQTPNGPNLKIMHSSHIAFGENNTCDQRIKSVKRMIASMSLTRGKRERDEGAILSYFALPHIDVGTHNEIGALITKHQASSHLALEEFGCRRLGSLPLHRSIQ